MYMFVYFHTPVSELWDTYYTTPTLLVTMSAKEIPDMRILETALRLIRFINEYEYQITWALISFLLKIKLLDSCVVLEAFNI